MTEARAPEPPEKVLAEPVEIELARIESVLRRVNWRVASGRYESLSGGSVPVAARALHKAGMRVIRARTASVMPLDFGEQIVESSPLGRRIAERSSGR